MLKAKLAKLKNLRGKITGHRATIGVLRAEGETPKAAELNVETEVLKALLRLERGTVIRVWNAHTFVVFPDTGGWRYWLDIFTPSGSTHSYSVQCPGDREDAEDAALFHLAQMIWTPEIADDAAFMDGLPAGVVKKLTSYFEWQRKYAAAKAAGHSDEDAHQIASGWKASA